MSPEPPRLSILVATWNCRPQLAELLESLAAQSWQDWQLLLLDNASCDGTAELVEDFRQRLACPERLVWSSQPDGGIYQAWNRGLHLARGEYVTFIGADDIFADAFALGRLGVLSAAGADLITARNSYYSPDGQFLRDWGSSWGWRRMRQSMNIAHPGMLIRRALFDQVGPFDERYRICGDYEWLLRLPPQLRTVHSSDVILKVVQAGVSHTQIGRVYGETFRAQSRYQGPFFSSCWWALNWLKYARRRLIGLA